MARNTTTENGGQLSWRKLTSSITKNFSKINILDLSNLKKEMETIPDKEQSEFCSIFIPWSVSTLSTLPPSHQADFVVRENIIEMYALLPSFGEHLKPYVNEIMLVLIKVLSEDYEANGLSSMHIFMEFHKVFRGLVESSVQPFIDLVLSLLEKFPDICDNIFDSNLPSRSSYIPSSQSVKIVIESPVMVVLLFQLHRKFINDNILKFVPFIIRILEISFPAPQFVIDSKLSDDFTLISGQIHSSQRQNYCDFIQAKVKVLSFLAYVSRSFSSALKSYQSSIPKFVIEILKNCPPESASARKELLVAVRHILATDLRHSFVTEFETLLDHNLLFGTGYTANNVMRPLVFSTMADLVHHIRLDLSSDMIIRVIDIYAKCFHDPSLPYGIQTMSAKLLLNLMDCVNGEKIDVHLRRPLSMKILSILLRKYSRLSKVVEEINNRRNDGSSHGVDKSFDAFWEDPLNSRIICSDSISADGGKDSIRDIKFVLKTITAGVKSIVLSFKTNYISYNSDTDAPVHSSNAFTNSCHFTLEESRLFLDMFRDGVSCFDLCQSESSLSGNSTSSITSISAEDKELVDQFAYIFTLLDPYIFQDVLCAHMEFLFEKIVSNPLLLIIPQYFLAINTVSRNFSGILIKFLMDRFDTISENSNHSNAMLRLFKLVFLAVSVYPDENENMILPHISDIILNCLRLSQKTSQPLNYFLILKSLFRGIAGGRFENLYKEVLPILPLLLESLNKLVNSTSDRQMQDLYVELCLTTPVRLSVLLPYLPFLMKPLVLSLISETELVNQGLRTLELCVDNLTQDFLEPILAPVLPDLLNALWILLRKGSSNHPQSQFALRILGKFGGRGRRFLKYPLNLKYVESNNAGISLVFDPLPDSDQLFELPLDSIIDLCYDFFSMPDAKPYESFKESDIFSLLCTSLSSICGFDVLIQQNIGGILSSDIHFIPETDFKITYDEASVQERLQNQNTPIDGTCPNSAINALHFKKLLSSLFNLISFVDSSLRISASEILDNICDRFVSIQVLAQRNQAKDYSFTGLTPNLFVEVLSEAICGPIESHGEHATKLISRIYTRISENVTAEKIPELPLFFLLVEKLIAYCYGSEFNRKIGACKGINLLCGFKLGARWMWMQESRIVRGLLFILKDIPAYASDLHISLISETLLTVLQFCHNLKEFHDSELKSKNQYYFNQIMSILISELTNSNRVVRNVIHSSFELLSKCHNCEVGELLSPHRDRILLPIFTKPLRALPFSLQIGYVDAVNYCLNLKPPLVTFSEELLRLLHESLALVEADDTALVSKSGQLKNSQNLINLRVVCIALLSTAISCSEFQDPKMHQIRNHIVSAFFKSLYSKSLEIVAVARTGLELVIVHQQKLPKDLLQHGLRPVLINLAEAKRLTLSGLEGLSKVLQLLTSYFKAEIGKKLLDHVSIWADQKLLEDLSSRPLLESMDVKIIVAILDVFHLLPPSANLFLDELVGIIAKLDLWTKRTQSSPFRLALIKFMYKHPADSVNFLLNHPDDYNYSQIFFSAIKDSNGSILLNEFNQTENISAFIDLLLHHRSNSEKMGLRIIFLKILIYSMTQLGTNFSIPHKIKFVLSAIISGASPLDASKEMISSSGEECELVLDLAFCYLNYNSSDLDTLISVISALDSASSCLDMTWVPKNVRNLCLTISSKREILASCMDHISSTESSLSSKSRLIRLVVLPTLAILKDQNTPLLKAVGINFLQKVDKYILSRDCTDLNSISGAIALEELQVASLLLSFDSSSSELKSILTPLRRFLLNRNTSPDPVIRYSALFSACNYICQIGLDIKILDGIIKSSLNIPTSEVRPLLRQTLSYALPHLLSNAGSSFLAAWLPDILSELSKNSHFLTVIAVFWSNFIQMKDQLSLHRAVLIRPLITCLSKAALSVFSVQEHRTYPFEISYIILSWLESDIELIEDIFVDQFVQILIKMTMLFSENNVDAKPFASDGLKILLLVSKLLQKHSRKLLINFDYFSKSLPPQIEVSDASLNSCCLFVNILYVISEFREDDQIINDYENLKRFFHFCLTSCNERLVTEICPLFSRICKINADSSSELFSALQHFLLENLQNSRALHTSMLILNTMQSNNVHISDNIHLSFLRTFQKLCTEHIVQSDNFGDSNMNDISVANFSKSFLIPSMSFAISSFCHANCSSKGTVFKVLKLIWEHSLSSDALLFLVDYVRNCFVEQEEIADFKEKAEIVSSPCKIFEINNETLMDKYLELILLIYSNARLRTTDLTMKLEGSFLFGLCYYKKGIRKSFFNLIDELIPRKLEDRIIFVFSSQRWNLVANSYWISFVIEFILSSWPHNLKQVSCLSWPRFSNIPFDSTILYSECIEIVYDIMNDVGYNSNSASHELWLQIFPQIWRFLSTNAREDLCECIVKVFSDPDFVVSSLNRPNAMKTLLDGFALLPNIPELPNNLVAYIGSEFGAWHSACIILENNMSKLKKAPKSHDYSPVKDLCQLYERLGETEMSSGIIRRYSIFPETNIALSFEQNKLWIVAQKILEKAQLKARSGSIPFFEDEFIVWGSHWENCAKKLQQWDLLSEVAKVDNNTNLALECEWVLNDWSRNETKTHIENLFSQIKESTKQKQMMESFILLNQLKESPEKAASFQSSMENLTQEILINWTQLPDHPSPAHCHALEQLQIVVEVQESQSFFANVSNSMNRPQFLQELKALLSTWRDRLPNGWEDTGVWSNLLAWRQHVFTAINSAFHNSASTSINSDTTSSAPGTTHPFAFRGYHETAWLINRFAHVARKNGMFDVSLSFLNKIYTLPNIEIQDAFLKLREQAKCYMENPAELPTALEVINATNLNYFNNTQKAEFFTLKAIVLSRLGMIDEANRIFAQAVQIDLNISKGWSSWGYFNDQRFQQSKDITFGVNAVNCYLQAATLCKSVNSRKYLARVLWLLTFEDSIGSMSKSFELYNHDLPSWYWVPFIPELLTSLNRREARQARFLLMKIAKSYPQALYLQLRTINEEYKMNTISSGITSPIQSESSSGSPNPSSISESTGIQSLPEKVLLESSEMESNISDQPFLKKSPHEHSEDLLGILKTGYPLLALSLENMVEHIIHRLRSSPEEDLYRIIRTLITENIQQTMIKLNANLSEQIPSPISVLETSLKKVADILGGSAYLAQKFKSSFENDFLNRELTLHYTLDRLLKWSHQLGSVLEKLPNRFHLENFSRYLAEFEHQKYDEIDIPGQYLLLREVGADFVKLERFDSQVEIIRRHGTSFRRIVMIGNDGSRSSFIVQNPSSRQSRREERLVQLLRMADAIVDKKVVTKRHSLSLGVQKIVPLSAFVRLIEDNGSYVSLEDIYEKYCKHVGFLPEDPVLYFRDCMFKGIEALQVPFKKGSVDLLNLRVDLFEEICQKFVPSTILNNYIKSIYPDFTSFWNFRRNFTSQYASLVFTSYILAIGHRFPHKIGFSQDSCIVASTEMLPALNQSGQFTLTEAVPFRLTPNIQTFLTEFGIEGPLTTYIVALGQALSGKKQDLADYLTLFVRDEVFTWANSNLGSSIISPVSSDEIINMQSDISSKIFQNVEIIMKRVQTLGCSKEIEKSFESLQPIDQTILDLISCAGNPQKLAHMDSHWHPCPLEEIQIVSELSQKLKKIRWNDSHFDKNITNYKEFTISDSKSFPVFYTTALPKITSYLYAENMLPVHVLELGEDGSISPHIDNQEYSGSVIAGLSLQRDSTLIFSNAFEKVQIKLPRRSFYVQRDDLRYNFSHSIQLSKSIGDIKSRISLLFRNAP